MSEDYGYFGSGDAGYAQYVATSGEDRDPKGSGGGGNKGGGQPKIGCFTVLGILFVIGVIGMLFD